MTLPMLIYDLEEETRYGLLEELGQLCRKAQLPVQLQLATNDLDGMLAELRGCRHVCLIVIGVPSGAADKERLAIRLGHYALKLNRDHYVVYMVKERTELEDVLPYCARSAGVLVCPPEEKAVRRVFGMVLEDYRRIYAQEADENDRYISLKSEGRVFRVRVKDICTVQALNKVIEYRTLSQTIAVYGSMSEAEKQLGESFVRCHRSYLINMNMIQYVDFREMAIHMADGTVIPLARSYKGSLQESMTAQA